jgi:peptide deformylase
MTLPNGTARTILVDPDPRLRRPTRRRALPDPATSALADDLIATMRAAHGLGLAAPQVGEPVRLAVVEVEGRLLVMVDPRIERQGPPAEGWEGCLSVPDRVALVRRPSWVEARWDDLHGRRRKMRAEGLLARAIVHEIDHLAGRLYTDLVGPEALVDTKEHPTPPGSTRTVET